MGAAAALFGALGGLGDFGEQRAEGSQAARDEIQKRLVEQEQRQAFQQQQREAQQRQRELQQRYQLEQQPIPIDKPFVAGGKTFQRYQNPLNGAVSLQELPGPLAETPEEQQGRGLKALGFSDEQIRDMMEKSLVKMPGGTRVGYAPDPANPGMEIATVYGYGPDGQPQPLYSYPTLQPSMMPRVTSGTKYDAATGLNLPFSSTSQRVMPGQAGLRFPAPSVPFMPTPGAAPRTAPGPAIRALTAPQVPAAAAAPPAGITPQAAAAPPSPVPGALTVGPYRALDSTGNIPATASTPQIVAAANRLINEGDVSKLPPRIQGLASDLARKYGWKGQGSLTPAQQMQLEQVDNSLKSLYNLPALKLFDDPVKSTLMAYFPIDPKAEGGLDAVVQKMARRGVPQPYLDYTDKLIRLRGVITAIRSFTGANNSNATADRMLAELPNFNNTNNSHEAALKLQQLMAEVSIIKRMGFFLDDSRANQIRVQPVPLPNPAAAAPAAGGGGTQPPAFPGAPPIGTIEDGHKYLGGDPTVESSWEQVKQ